MLLLFCSCYSVDVTFNRNVNTAEINRIAIFPFDMEARQGASGKLEESFTVEFLRMGCNPVDRGHLNRLLKEQALSQTGITDSSHALQIGKLAGANAIVIGSGIVETRQRLDVLRKAFIQVIDVETSSVLLAGTLQTGALLTMEEFTQEIGRHLKGKICLNGNP
ncbi:MAG: hypothetical protein HS115_19935 [Spirochaetales bacterium]|nr:hypothetical protein [Spirochaetales bacterium]